jgi:hypothetical protein
MMKTLAVLYQWKIEGKLGRNGVSLLWQIKKSLQQKMLKGLIDSRVE